MSVLREAARRDEHETPLAEPLLAADRAALDLVMEWTRKPKPDAEPRPEPVASEPAPVTRPVTRVHARDVPAWVEKICEAADANPDAEFEISWRIVPS